MLSTYDQNRIDYEVKIKNAEFEAKLRLEELNYKSMLEHNFKMQLIDIEFRKRKLKYLRELREDLADEITTLDNLIDSLKGGG